MNAAFILFHFVLSIYLFLSGRLLHAFAYQLRSAPSIAPQRTWCTAPSQRTTVSTISNYDRYKTTTMCLIKLNASPNSLDNIVEEVAKTGHKVKEGKGLKKEKIQGQGQGRVHTAESRAKISKANKGKTPWNVGRKHSEETKRKIAERTMQAMLKRKTEHAASLGLTVEQLDNIQNKEREKKRQKKKKGGLTEEGRRRISEAMKKRWQQPGFKEQYSEQHRGKRAHSEETRLKISEALKQQWQNETYRNRTHAPRTEEQKAHLSEKLKARWQDPEFRSKMLSRQRQRTPEWRAQVSAKIKAKWKDPAYRDKVAESMRAYYQRNPHLRSQTSTQSGALWGSGKQSRSGKGSQWRRAVINPLNARERQRRAAARALATAQNRKMQQRSEALWAAQKAAVLKDTKIPLKEILGGELWFEEKLKRKQSGVPFQDDATFEARLMEEWGALDKSMFEDDPLPATHDSNSSSSSRSRGAGGGGGAGAGAAGGGGGGGGGGGLRREGEEDIKITRTGRLDVDQGGSSLHSDAAGVHGIGGKGGLDDEFAKLSESDYHIDGSVDERDEDGYDDDYDDVVELIDYDESLEGRIYEENGVLYLDEDDADYEFGDYDYDGAGGSSGDMVEVYDDTGELVGVYSESEFLELRRQQQRM